MAHPLSVVVETPRRFPAAVDDVLGRRRSDLLSIAGGAVLDLDRPEARQEVARAASGAPVDAAYDSAVSVAQLARFPDLVAALRGVDRLVGAHGHLLLVEPVAHPGMLSILLGSACARLPAVASLHLNRDITAAVRATTFAHDVIERFTMPTWIPPLRHAVEIRAARSPARVAPAGSTLEVSL